MMTGQTIVQKEIEALVNEIRKLQDKYELSKTITPDYFDPGNMEYLEQYQGVFDKETGNLFIRFDARGTRYDGRTEQIERVKEGDVIQVIRDSANEYNHNNFTFLTAHGQNVGNMPAELCNVIAPLYDRGLFHLVAAKASFVDPISKRNRHAKQAVLFVEIKGVVTNK